MLVQEQTWLEQEVFQLFQYLPGATSIDINAADFNYAVMKVTSNQLWNIFTDYFSKKNSKIKSL